jgi:CheY-like chemotaxis protein
VGPMTREVDVFLVEDNQADMTLTLRALSGQVSSDRVRVARDGEEALDFVICRGVCSNETSVPRLNLILLDLKLPKFNGMDVLAEWKTDARTKVIPVVIFSSSKQSSKEGSRACCSAQFLDLRLSISATFCSAHVSSTYDRCRTNSPKAGSAQ